MICPRTSALLLSMKRCWQNDSLEPYFISLPPPGGSPHCISWAGLLYKTVQRWHFPCLAGGPTVRLLLLAPQELGTAEGIILRLSSLNPGLYFLSPQQHHIPTSFSSQLVFQFSLVAISQVHSACPLSLTPYQIASHPPLRKKKPSHGHSQVSHQKTLTYTPSSPGWGSGATGGASVPPVTFLSILPP